MSLKELHEQGETLRKLLILSTYPLAAKLTKSGAEFPDKTRLPADFKGRRWAMCQAWAVSRTTGWTIGLTLEQSICPPCNIFFGWVKQEDENNLVDTWLEMGVARNVQAVKRYIGEHVRLEKGECSGLVFSPLQWTKVIPDVVMIYCNPAQAGVLIGAYIYKEGKSINSTFRSSVVCASSIIGTLKTDEPQISIPCTGEKGMGRSQDFELIFTFPGKMLVDIIEGLQAALKHGYNRIPTVPYLLYEPDLIPLYQKLEKKLKFTG